MQVWIATTPVDMRKSFDGLAEAVRKFLGHDPLSGSMFVFRNRSSERVKIIWWDRDGFVIYYKKLKSHYPHFLLFTEIGGYGDNLADRLAAAVGMDADPTNNGPRRRPMPGENTVIAPPAPSSAAGP